MEQYTALVKRNMRIYLRDRGAVFFSLLSMLIVLGLMLFFLGDMNVDSLKDFLSELPGRNAEADEANALMFVTLWTCAGIVSINAVTVTLAVFSSSMIKDRETGKSGSIYTAPVSRATVSAAYVTSAWICSLVICILTLVISEIYCIIQGGEAFSAAAHLKLIGMIAVNSFTYSSLMYLGAVLVKTQSAWSGIGTVVGTLVGFLGGIYLPIGTLSEGIQTALKCSPVIYGAKMFRSIMTENIITEIFADIPKEYKTEYLEAMGVELEFMDMQMTDTACIGILICFGIVFLIAGIIVSAKKSGTDR
ncbi:MAG: ABC transporter permease [Oscillospiraceae bacterium]|nr:ABC transporter permease [Oscillospiraceae bacterium]